MTPRELLAEVSRLPPDGRVEYYRGAFAHDIEQAQTKSKRVEIWRLLQMSRSMMQYGVVMLCQKKMGEWEYAHYAIRTKKSGMPPVLHVIASELENATEMREPSSWWGNSTI